MQGLFAAFATLLDPGDEVLMFSPYWTPIMDLIAYHQAQGRSSSRPTPPAREGLAKTLARLTTSRTKVLYWNSPNNPTGDVFSRREVEEVAEFARRSNLAVISDEAYEDLVYEGEPNVAIASLPGMYERTITAFTLSKSYSMTGWRLGYVIAPARYQSAVKTVVLYSTNGVSTPTQWAAVEALSRGTEFVAEWKAGYRSRRDRLVAGLKAAGFGIETPRAALYLFAKLPVLARHGLAGGRAHAARRGQDRHRSRRRLRPRGRRPPAVFVLRLRRDDRGRRRGARRVRQPGRRAPLITESRRRTPSSCSAPTCSSAPTRHRGSRPEWRHR